MDLAVKADAAKRGRKTKEKMLVYKLPAAAARSVQNQYGVIPVQRTECCVVKVEFGGRLTAAEGEAVQRVVPLARLRRICCQREVRHKQTAKAGDKTHGPILCRETAAWAGPGVQGQYAPSFAGVSGDVSDAGHDD